MRLTQLKIAGFKSFIEPTVIPTLGSLVAIVGPNGCGKSNIIDAVRWVMGESRASELRGGSMQDVIFNGSAQRKAAARASVELVFNNSNGRAAGQWSVYSEISIRRVLTRDGTSSYFINNQQVRRRDVYDVFLGTGLGARGYAIIGQGMINRLIEARPEELRVYLEEAAGVSRYKDRRRETENRLRDTRENLDRLEDILSELTLQVQRLEKQAEVATNYKKLQQEAEQKQQILWLLNEQRAKQDQIDKAAAIAKSKNDLEQAIAKLRAQEALIESHRQSHYACSDAVHQAQGKLYEAGALVSKLEAEIKHMSESTARLQQRQQNLQQQCAQWSDQISYCVDQIAELEIKLENALAELEETEAKADYAQNQMPDLESELNREYALQENLRQVTARTQQELALAQQANNTYRQQLQTLDTRKASLEHARSQVVIPASDQLYNLQQQNSKVKSELNYAKEQLAALESQLLQNQENHNKQASKAAKITESLAKAQASLGALQTLQNNVSQKDSLTTWLSNLGLHGQTPLWQQISIESGWEAAVEACLHNKINALNVSSFEGIIENLQSGPPSRLTVYVNTNCNSTARDSLHGMQPLAEKITTNNPELLKVLQFWLYGAYTCPNLSKALNKQASLVEGCCFVMPNGHIVDRTSIHFYAPDSEQSGLFARQAEINHLQLEAKHLNDIAEQSSHQLQLSKEGLNSLQVKVEELRLTVSELTEIWHNGQIAVNNMQQQHKQEHEKAEQLLAQIAELDEEKQDLLASSEDLTQRLHQLQHSVAESQAKLEDAMASSEALRARASNHNEIVRSLERQQQEAEYEIRTIKSRIEEVNRNRQLAIDQKIQTQTELDSLQGELFELHQSVARDALQHALEQRIATETKLTEERTKLDNLSAELRSYDEQRMKLEQSLEPLRAKITELQLQEQAARLSVEQFAEQLQAHNANRHDLMQVLENAPDQWRKPAWLQSEVQRVSNQINQLGAVNLAALEELNTAREREGFLFAQHQDLLQAITTLEDAIRNIDKETRTLLQNTFNQVNGHFGELFPKLFGGGDAFLTMTGEEILDAGVQVMAQPPGKRNSTIQLLSGGEKALTAIALVFALFKLNPAPFCMLDEVDAPLDDANTGRFAALVSDMSDQTQFLFVSHNKITMQIAQQLIGVTMQEQGVSRIVAVDMESALQMAEA